MVKQETHNFLSGGSIPSAPTIFNGVYYEQ